MVIITVINNKGGVSKTVTSINIASYLSQQSRVLLIDLDAQANATTSTIGETNNSHVGQWLVGEKKFSEVVKQYETSFDVLPSARALDNYTKLIGTEPDYQFILKERIDAEKLSLKYDYIVIDNAPSLSTLAYTTFLAATHVVIPSAPEEHSISGIANILQTVVNVKKRYNPNLKVAGIFFSKYHSSYRERIDNDMVNDARNAFGDLVLQTSIRKNVSIKEALAFKKSVFDYAPDSAGASDYKKLVEEIKTKI